MSVFLPYYEQLEAIFKSTFEFAITLILLHTNTDIHCRFCSFISSDVRLFFFSFVTSQNFRMDPLHTSLGRLVQVLAVNVSLHRFYQCNNNSD